jgi:hypothetical protein
VFHRFVLNPEYESGLAYRTTISSRAVAGKMAGKRTLDKYLQVRIKGIDYICSRIVWYLATGLDPGSDEIDHVDHNPLNNSIDNLRICTRRQNNTYQSIRKDNTSGYKGVSWRKDTGIYTAHLQVDKKRMHIGYHICPVKLAYQYNIEAIKHNGRFAILNKGLTLDCI